MSRGKYIVLEGPEGVGKTAMARLVVHELERLGVPVRSMHEPDGTADATTREIRRLTQDPSYPMNTHTEVLLYNAARSQSLEAVRAAQDNGEVVIVDRSYLTTLAVQFYGRGDVAEYQRLNDIIAFAVRDMWPDLTIVLDAPVALLQERSQKRGEKERFDNLDAETLERIRAGYLWEAKQRSIPVVYAHGRIDEVFQDVWRHVAALLKLEGHATSEPTALAELLAKSPAAHVLESKKASITAVPTPYYVPESLPDDVQCDYCDGMDRLLSLRQKLVSALDTHLASEAYEATDKKDTVHLSAESILGSTLPVACGRPELRALIDSVETIDLDTETQKLLPLGFSTNTEPVRLVSVSPRNELDLLPYMLYETLDLPLVEVKNAVENWPYEVKSQLLLEYLRRYPNGKALDQVRYEWDFLLPLADLSSSPLDLLPTVRLQALTPRYGYDIPAEIEAAGLSDDFDALCDASLELQSTLQARGYAVESRYATLLAHKQRWSMSLTPRTIAKLSPDNSLKRVCVQQATEKHSLIGTILHDVHAE